MISRVDGLRVGWVVFVVRRVVGRGRRLRVAELPRGLTPVAVAGLVVMAAIGSILFGADGAALARSAIFERKLIIIAAALANAAAFRWVWNARMEIGRAHV